MTELWGFFISNLILNTMKATKRQIKHLADQFNDIIENLHIYKITDLRIEYQNNPVKTAWNLYWKAYDMEPELWRNETKHWKDSHIQTLIKQAMKYTFFDHTKIK